LECPLSSLGQTVLPAGTSCCPARDMALSDLGVTLVLRWRVHHSALDKPLSASNDRVKSLISSLLRWCRTAPGRLGGLP
jgi:hypothetical protein